MKLRLSVISLVLPVLFVAFEAQSSSVEKVSFTSERVSIKRDFFSQSKEMESASDSEEINEEEPEGAQISNSFYIGALIVIIIAGYFMNKRKPLLNQ